MPWKGQWFSSRKAKNKKHPPPKKTTRNLNIALNTSILCEVKVLSLTLSVSELSQNKPMLWSYQWERSHCSTSSVVRSTRGSTNCGHTCASLPNFFSWITKILGSGCPLPGNWIRQIHEFSQSFLLKDLWSRTATLYEICREPCYGLPPICRAH